MTEPDWIDVPPADDSPVALKALSWGPAEGPVALCLHGFPDTAYGWRNLAPTLVEAGYRVVAPFLRGYAPSAIAPDGSYHIGALMHDALRVREAAGGTADDVVIGHDWGALTATGLAAMPDSPLTKAVVMSVPPVAAFRAATGWPDRLRLAGLLPAQALRSWYIGFFQLPMVPERAAARVVPLLWRRWSPGYDATDDLRHVDAAIGTPEGWRAALGPYRATIRNPRPPARYAELHRHWQSAPRLPTLYLHGRDDGCMTADFVPWASRVLPPGSDAKVIDRAGHFLQLEAADEVGDAVLAFLDVPG